MCQPSNNVIFLSFSHLFHVSPPCDGKIRRAVQQTAVEEKQQEKRSHPALSSALLFSLSLCTSEAPVRMTGRVIVLPHFQVILIKTVFSLFSYTFPLLSLSLSLGYFSFSSNIHLFVFSSSVLFIFSCETK